MTPQEEFDAKYITSTEICTTLEVTRASVVNARERGDLPEPLRINRPSGDCHIMFWLREEASPYVERWRVKLAEARAS